MLADYRTEFYWPRTWSQELANGWLGSGRRTNISYAREFMREFERDFGFAPRIPEEGESELRGIIMRAVRAGRARL